MIQKIYLASFIISSTTIVGLMWGRYQDHQRIDQLQSEVQQLMSGKALVRNKLTLMIEKEGYAKCNGDYRCQKRYPHAFREVEEAEAAESRELEKKSTYKEKE